VGHHYKRPLDWVSFAEFDAPLLHTVLHSDFVTTGTFTAPVTGRYQLSSRIGVTGSSATGQLFVAITTSNRTYRGGEIPATAGVAQGCTVSILADMDAGDTATTNTSLSGGTKTADVTTPGSYFSGYLAC
jgi:hypothetical protein